MQYIYITIMAIVMLFAINVSFATNVTTEKDAVLVQLDLEDSFTAIDLDLDVINTLHKDGNVLSHVDYETITHNSTYRKIKSYSKPVHAVPWKYCRSTKKMLNIRHKKKYSAKLELYSKYKYKHYAGSVLLS